MQDGSQSTECSAGRFSYPLLDYLIDSLSHCVLALIIASRDTSVAQCYVAAPTLQISPNLDRLPYLNVRQLRIEKPK